MNSNSVSCYLSSDVSDLHHGFHSQNCYRPQRSCEGYVFTRVCQSFRSQGGELSQHALQVVSQHALQWGMCYPSMHCRWYPSMPCSRGVCSWGSLLWGLPAPRGCLLPGGCVCVDPPPKADGYCCGWYTSYWSAFLLNCYRPQRSCEGYVFTRVCQSFRSQGGELSQHALQVVSQHALQWGMCYPSMHCRWYPSMPCSRGVCSWGGLLWGLPAPRGCLLPGGCVCVDPPRKQMATVADGTHPTGVHSC